MSNSPPTAPPPGATAAQPARKLWRLLVVWILRLRVWITEEGPGDLWESNYFWAVLVGVGGALSSVLFREALSHLEFLLFHYDGPLEYAATATQMPWWLQLAVPTAGGLVAGAILFFGQRLPSSGKSADFMEALVLGDGVIRTRATLVKSFSSLVTIASGGSIGREGAMVQLASMVGSLTGRVSHFTPARLRLLVACGAASGIACAYNAPLTGAFFVAEIVLGSIAMESIGPLIVASVIATATAAQFLGNRPLYDPMPDFGIVSNWQLLTFGLLGVVAGLLAPLFLLLLRGGEVLFQRTKLPMILRLGLGGLIVGGISLWHPESWKGGGVWGNGYGVVESVLNTSWVWWGLLTILLCKVLATVATTGSGAVGGVFTPTLFCGAIIGALFADGLRYALPEAQMTQASFIVVGMGCFLAATTRAPIMSILIMFEMTHKDAAVMPLMLACVAAFYVSKSISAESVYSRKLRGGHQSERPIFLLHVRDLMKKEPLFVSETAGFALVAASLAAHTFKHLYVVDANRRFLGAIALQDLKPFLHDTELPNVVIALDLMHDDVPVLTSDASLKESLEIFGRHDGERLPVLDNPRDRRLVGALSKTDVLLTLAHGAGAKQDEN